MCAQPRATTEVRFATSGQVSADDVERARRAVLEAVDRTERPVSAARVTLSVVADPELPRPALVQVTSELGGRRVRAQAAAPSLQEAIDLMGDRFAIRLTDLRAS